MSGEREDGGRGREMVSLGFCFARGGLHSLSLSLETCKRREGGREGRMAG